MKTTILHVKSNGDIAREVKRRVPLELSAAQVACRAKIMRNRHRMRKAVKEVIKPGDSFFWPEKVPEYIGAKATVLRFQDQWCYVQFTWPDRKPRQQNFGFKRIYDVLKQVGKIKEE